MLTAGKKDLETRAMRTSFFVKTLLIQYKKGLLR